jgi:hypothetical protein
MRRVIAAIASTIARTGDAAVVQDPQHDRSDHRAGGHQHHDLGQLQQLAGRQYHLRGQDRHRSALSKAGLA